MNVSIPLGAAGIGPIDNAGVAVRKPGDFLHLRRAERKIENACVFRKPLFFAGARDHDDLVLYQKSQSYLRRSLAMRGADARQQLSLRAPPRAIGL